MNRFAKKLIFSTLFLSSIVRGQPWQQNSNGIYYTAGNVGIGTSIPTAMLDVNGSIQGYSLSGNGLMGATSKGYAVVGQADGAGWGGLFRFGSDGHNSAYLGAKDNAAMFYGLVTIHGNASVSVLTITGGSDLSEPFQISSEKIPKGSVVVIDEKHPGNLKLSTLAYDTRVAGIISGARGVTPGISMHQDGLVEGGQNVALSGRIYALADDSNGPIKPGDLLTTSTTPGHCMKATDNVRAFGAVVGKAMSSLKSGKGLVLVLVSLQ
jgi:hypothetical protein